MRIPKRAAFRLAVAGWFGLAGLSTVATLSLAAAPPEKVFPDSAVFFLKVPNAAGLREAFGQSQLGQLWADPAMQPFKDDIKAKLADSSAKLKAQVGVTIKELLEIPQGPISVAVIPKDDADVPVAIVITADAGKNAAQLADVMAKADAAAEKDGAKVSKETVKGLSVHVITPLKSDKKDDKPTPPIVWTRSGDVFYVGTDLDAVKDLIGNADGRSSGALASSEAFAAATKKLGLDAQAFWYSDLVRLLDLVNKAGSKGKNAASLENFKAMSQLLGINGLKAAAGTIGLNSGNYDTVTKTFVVAPAPLQGVLKLFALPKVALKPEPWVPATVASYQTFSWDLDGAYTAINDLANQFQPGVLQVLEQQLVGPNGGEPLSFKKDVFDPLGDRITVIGDFKKPITEDSQRMVIAVALEDAPAFTKTLNKLIALAGGAPKKREFQGSTIYDFDLPEMPNAAGANVKGVRGPVSVTIAKNTVFLATEPTLLEMVLRGGPSLADTPGFQAVAKEIPPQSSSLSYVKPEESARVSYEMIKSGQFEKALAGAAVAGGPDVSKVGKLINKDKLPDFSVFTKYLSQGGGFAFQDEDGLTITNFSLRKTNP